jgi:hypothetical protein
VQHQRKGCGEWWPPQRRVVRGGGSEGIWSPVAQSARVRGYVAAFVDIGRPEEVSNLPSRDPAMEPWSRRTALGMEIVQDVRRHPVEARVLIPRSPFSRHPPDMDSSNSAAGHAGRARLEPPYRPSARVPAKN